MYQPQTNIYKLEEHQSQPNRKDNYVDETQLSLKDIGIHETQPNQKALEWLRTQFYERQWEEQENNEKSIQKTFHKPIIDLYYLNYSEHFIRTMVDEVLTKSDFDGDSSIYVVLLPSDNDDSENYSYSQYSTIGIKMSTNPMKWKNIVHEQPAGHGVKIFSKGEKLSMEEGLPAEIPSSDKQKTLSNHKHLKDETKRATKNKLCQCNTPDGVVGRLEYGCDVITDTTADRPCCCSLKTTHCSNYSPNEKYVADAMSKRFSPLVEKHGPTGDECHIPLLKKNAQELVEPVTAPQAPCHIQPCRHSRAQHHRAYDQCHNYSAPEHDNSHLIPHPDKLFNNLHHATVTGQYETNLTTQNFIPYVASRPDKLYPDYAQPCFNPHPNNTCPDPHPSKPSPNTHLAKSRPAQETTNLLQKQTCQCNSVRMLELLKLAWKGGKTEDMQLIGCGKRAEPPKSSSQKPTQFTMLAPCNEPDLPIRCALKSKANDQWCPCERPSTGETTLLCALSSPWLLEKDSWQTSGPRTDLSQSSATIWLLTDGSQNEVE